jgi:hypothetical protein
MTATTGRRGLIAAVCVVLAVVAAVFMVSMRSTAVGTVPSVSRKLVGPSSVLENKMAFKAMKMNTKYELKSEQKTILRGGSIQVRHDAAAAMKANIYSGIKDMKRVVLAGLNKGQRRLTEVVDSVHRKLPSVHVIKGAYAAMKGQIKTTILLAKKPILEPAADFNQRHALIHDLKFDIKKAITNERNIIETDDDDDDTTPRKLIEEVAKKIEKKQATKRAEAEAKSDAKELKEEVKGDKKEVKQLKKEVKADKEAIKADKEVVEDAKEEADVIAHPPKKGSKLGQVQDETPAATAAAASTKSSSSKASSKASKKTSSKQ